MDSAPQADHLGQQRLRGVDPVRHGFRFCHLASSFRDSIEHSGRERNRSLREGRIFAPAVQKPVLSAPVRGSIPVTAAGA
jgi:hypothetical protein